MVDNSPASDSSQHANPQQHGSAASQVQEVRANAQAQPRQEEKAIIPNGSPVALPLGVNLILRNPLISSLANQLKTWVGGRRIRRQSSAQIVPMMNSQALALSGLHLEKKYEEEVKQALPAMKNKHEEQKVLVKRRVVIEIEKPTEEDSPAPVPAEALSEAEKPKIIAQKWLNQLASWLGFSSEQSIASPTVTPMVTPKKNVILKAPQKTSKRAAVILRLVEEAEDENQEEKSDSSVSRPEIVREFADSIDYAETWLRQQMQSVLDEQVYKEAILNGPKNEQGYYTNIPANNEDPLFYYLHMLNLLIAAPQILRPAADIVESYLDAVKANPSLHGKLWVWLSKYFSQEGAELNQKFNQADEAFTFFVDAFAALGLPSFPRRLSELNELVEMAKGMPFVQSAQKQFDLNPLVTSVLNNADHWRELGGWPRASELKVTLDNQIGNEKSVLLKKAVRGAVEVINEENNHREKTRETIKKFAAQVDSLVSAALVILKDLSGNDVTTEIKKEFEKTAEAIKEVLKKLGGFDKPLSWGNIFNLIYRLLPLLQQLIASLPPSYMAIDRLLRERVMVCVRQLNFILRECFLDIDRMESYPYFKEGLIFSVGEGRQGCGLLGVNFDPMNPSIEDFDQLQQCLGSNKDAYVVFGLNFYYLCRRGEGALRVEPLDIRPANVAVPNKPLVDFLKDQPSADGMPPQLMMTQADAEYLKWKLGINAELEVAQKNDWLFKKLKAGQFRYIESLTGHHRDKDSYDELNVSLSNIAKVFNDLVKAAGYQLPSKEHPPYHRVIKEQRQKLLAEHCKKMGVANPEEVKESDMSADAIRLRQLKRRVDLSEQQDAKQKKDKVECANKEWFLKERSLDLEKKKILQWQIEGRIAQLRAEKTFLENHWSKSITRIFSLTHIKLEKIDLLHEFKEKMDDQIKQGKEPCIDSVLEMMRTAGKKIELLLEGRTGKTVRTLKALTLTPERRIQLITDEIKSLKKNLVQDQKYFFFAEWRNKIRRKHLDERIRALKKFRKWIKRSGYRIQECLDNIKAKSGAEYKVLIKERKLIEYLRESDALRPNSDIGKINLRFFPLPKPQPIEKSEEKKPTLVISPLNQ